MSERSVRPWSVLGYWLLYSVTGFLLLITADSGGVDISEDRSSPMRTASKVVGAVSGALLVVSALGWWLVNDAVSNQGSALAIATLGSIAAAVTTIVAWVMIATDLRKRKSR